MSRKLPAVNTFLNKGEADRQTLKRMIDELERVPEWKWARCSAQKSHFANQTQSRHRTMAQRIVSRRGLGRTGMKSACQRNGKHGEGFWGDCYA